MRHRAARESVALEAFTVVTKEVVDLAERLPSLQAAVKAKAVELRKHRDDQDKAKKAAAVKEKALRKELHELQGQANAAGGALALVERSVAPELIQNVQKLEIAERALVTRLKEAELNAKLARDEVERLTKLGADAQALEPTKKRLDGANLAVAEVAGEVKTNAGRLEKARAEFRAAVEASKKVAKGPTPAATPPKKS